MSSLRDEIDPSLAFILEAGFFSESLAEAIKPILDKYALCALKISKLKSKNISGRGKAEKIARLQSEQQYCEMQILDILKNFALLQ